jgi:hypothetical protein
VSICKSAFLNENVLFKCALLLSLLLREFIKWNKMTLRWSNEQKQPPHRDQRLPASYYILSTEARHLVAFMNAA